MLVLALLDLPVFALGISEHTYYYARTLKLAVVCAMPDCYVHLCAQCQKIRCYCILAPLIFQYLFAPVTSINTSLGRVGGGQHQHPILYEQK